MLHCVSSKKDKLWKWWFYSCVHIWAASWQNQPNGCAPSKDSDQPEHLPSLIRVFAVCMKKAWVLSYPLGTQRRCWSDWADAQADLSLRRAHIPLVVLRLFFFLYKEMHSDFSHMSVHSLIQTHTAWSLQDCIHISFICLFVLKFYGSVDSYGHVKPVSYPLTLFLGRLRPTKRLTSS